MIADASILFWRATEGSLDSRAEETLIRSQEASPWLSPSLAVFELGNVVHRKQKSRLGGDKITRKAIFRTAEAYTARASPTLDDLGETADVCESIGISFYDASYLQLARSLGKPVLTTDRGMAAHARALGLTAYCLPEDLDRLRNDLSKAEAPEKA